MTPSRPTTTGQYPPTRGLWQRFPLMYTITVMYLEGTQSGLVHLIIEVAYENIV